mmetsp:Transcript_1361/g.2956  ORF Transcript_1361/g.2956 Transcript_1361/m.2956 type:complete len:305 (+) Transcript_1361:359-1273(+)
MQMTVMPTPAKCAPLLTLPFLSVVSKILVTVASSSAQWAWKLAWKPAVRTLACSGRSMTMIWQMSLDTERQGGSVQMTNPFWTSSVDAPAILIRTFSPGRAEARGVSSFQTPSTLYFCRVGIMMILAPGRMVPLSTLPMATVPLSVYLSSTGMRTGASGSLPFISSESRRLMSVGLLVLLSPFFQALLHHGHTLGSTSSLTLAPLSPEMGMNLTSFLILKPQPLRNGLSLFTHSSKRCFCHFTVGSSILLMTTTRCDTPSVFARRACSLVWPPLSNPLSNSPFLAEMTSTPTSAWLAPMIMLGT